MCFLWFIGYTSSVVDASFVARIFVYRRRAPAANAAIPEPSSISEAGSGTFGGGVGVGVGQFGHSGGGLW